jgi:preprotein translocase subunit SecY
MGRSPRSFDAARITGPFLLIKPPPMISAFANSFKVPELRSRILFTLAMIVIVRIGTSITLPGVDPAVLGEWINNKAGDNASGAAQVAALLNIFSGGGMQNVAIFALGIMPYISASIMLQLLTAVWPPLSKLAREEGGRQKITQYTRIATIVLCVFQATLLAQSLADPNKTTSWPACRTPSTASAAGLSCRTTASVSSSPVSSPSPPAPCS